MKKIFLVFFLILVVCFCVLAFFVLTFDASKYKGQIENEATKAIGNPVEIGDISLGWKNGLALQIFDIRVSENNENVLSLDGGSVTLKLLPLLKKSVEVASIHLDSPQAQIIRKSDGVIQVKGVKMPSEVSPEIPESAPEAKESSVTSAPADSSVSPMTFLVSQVVIENAKVSFVDESPEFPVNVVISDVDFSVKNISFHRPIDFTLDLSLLSLRQNIHAEGRIRLFDQGQRIVIEPLQVDADFMELDLEQLLLAVPKLKEAQFTTAPRGRADVKLEKLELSPEGMKDITATIRLKDGFVSVASVPVPVEDINTEIVYQTEIVDLKSFTASVAGGEISASSVIKNLSSEAKTSLKVNVENVEMSKVVPASPGVPTVTGKAFFLFDGFFSLGVLSQGVAVPEISRTLTGTGRLALKNGVVQGVNILEQVFSKLSEVPLLSDALQRKIPESLAQKLQKEDTHLNDIDQSFSIENGVVQIPDFSISTEDLSVSGNAQASLIGHVDLKATAHLSSDVSSVLTRMVNELEYVLDDQGRFAIPVSVNGQNPNFNVSMDVQGIISSVLSSTAQKQIGKLVGKALGDNASGSDDPLSALLGRALGGTPSNNNQSQNDEAVAAESSTNQPSEDVSVGDAGMLLSSLLQQDSQESSQEQSQGEAQEPEDVAAQLLGGFLRKALNE